MANDYKIAASILSADFAKLGEESANVIAAGADMIHFDVMDNHFVPNLTIGPIGCEALRSYGISAPIDAHLMITPTNGLIERFAHAGATYITIHAESEADLAANLMLIKELGCQTGLAFNPETPLDMLGNMIDMLDMVLIMSVHPGFGGQSFIEETLDKIKEARGLIDASKKPIRLEVDGGIKTHNIKAIATAGADTFVAGSAIFDTDDYVETIAEFRDKLG